MLKDNYGGDYAAISIREHQPHIVVTIDETTHIISLVDLRLMANSTDTPELVRILSKAIVDMSQ